MTDQEKLIECYEQIGDLRQTLKEIQRLALDVKQVLLSAAIASRADQALKRTKPNMETEYEAAD